MRDQTIYEINGNKKVEAYDVIVQQQFYSAGSLS